MTRGGGAELLQAQTHTRVYSSFPSCPGVRALGLPDLVGLVGVAPSSSWSLDSCYWRGTPRPQRQGTWWACVLPGYSPALGSVTAGYLGTGRKVSMAGPASS